MAEVNHWMLVSSLENFRLSKEYGFTLAGMKSRHRKKAEKVRPGDKVVFYLTGVQQFGGIAEATSEYSEDHSPLWESKKKGEDYPFRFSMNPRSSLMKKDFSRPSLWRARWIM